MSIALLHIKTQFNRNKDLQLDIIQKEFKKNERKPIFPSNFFKLFL